MNRIEGILEDLQRMYLPQEDYIQTMKAARDLFLDLQYIKEHFNRTKKSDYSLKILPSIDSNINGRFVEEVFRYLKVDNDNILRALIIIRLANELVYIVYKNAWEFNTVPKCKLDEYLCIEDIIKYYYDIDLTENLGWFIGCSSGIDTTYEKIIEYKNKLNEEGKL